MRAGTSTFSSPIRYARSISVAASWSRDSSLTRSVQSGSPSRPGRRPSCAGSRRRRGRSSTPSAPGLPQQHGRVADRPGGQRLDTTAPRGVEVDPSAAGPAGATGSSSNRDRPPAPRPGAEPLEGRAVGDRPPDTVPSPPRAIRPARPSGPSRRPARSRGSTRSCGPPPRRHSTHSATSTALPTARPSGWSIRVIRATICLPRPRPISHIVVARCPRVVELAP